MLVYIILSTLSAYFAAVIIMKYIKNSTLDDAQRIVNNFIINYLKDFKSYLVSNPEAVNNWLPDDILIQNVLNALQPFTLIPIGVTLYNTGLLGNVPFLKIRIIPPTNFSLPALKTVLNNVVLQRLAYAGVANPLIYVNVIPVSASDAEVLILYGVTPQQKQALQTYVCSLTTQQARQARQTVQTIVDTDLDRDIRQAQITKSNKPTMQVGYDVQTCAPISIDLLTTGMVAVVGGTGSGKSVAVLYLLYNLKKTYNAELFVGDFKRSGDFVGISNSYADAEAVPALVDLYYELFLQTPENNTIPKILLIDEYAGMITWLSQQDKKKAEEIKGKISSMLMMGRSRGCFVWCVQQRMSASLFPSGIGAVDNFQVCIGLGRLSPDSRKSLFAGEHLQDADFEANYKPGTGQGLILVDGQPLQALEIPKISDKENLQQLLRNS